MIKFNNKNYHFANKVISLLLLYLTGKIFRDAGSELQCLFEFVTDDSSKCILGDPNCTVSD